MSTAQTLYRSTLVAAALAVGSLAIAPAALAHDHGWRDHDGDRGWYDKGRRGHDWDGDRGWRGDRGWHGNRGGYRYWAPPAYGYRRYRDWDDGYYYRPWRAPSAYYYPAPRYDRDCDDDVSLVIRIPF